MSETLAAGVEQANSEVLPRTIENLEIALSNARTLREVLAEPEREKRRVLVETRSSCVDIGGFYMNLRKSDPRYRDLMFIGLRNGDALQGTLEDLIGGATRGRDKLEFRLNVGDDSDPIYCYFKLEDAVLFGCRITRLEP